MEFRILGPLEVVGDDGGIVDLGGPKQRAVLTILLLERGRVVSVDRLIERLWGDEPPASATGSLQAYVSNLRRALEPGRVAGAAATVLVTQAPGYRLDVDPSSVDAVRFEEMVREGEDALAAGDVERASSVLAAARARWRGPALVEVAYESYARGEVDRLEELRLTGLEAWAEAELAAGHHSGLVGELESLVMANPLRSRLRRQLMLALYRSGRQADALRVYKEGRAVLRDELGVEPDSELQALEERILLQSPDLDWQPPAVEARPTPARPGAAGDGATGASEQAPLVGRDRESAALDRALIESASGRGRIVLLSGEPGIGKTRLAEAVTERAAGRGSLVGWSRSFEAEGVPAFWPWVQVLRAVAAGVGDDELRAAAGSGAAELARLAPELAERLDVRPSGASSGRFAVYDAVTRTLVGLSVARPVVVVLDDVQWADAASLRLLEYVAGEIRSARVAVVATFRDAEVDEALAGVLATIAPFPHVERVSLGGLPEGDVGRVVAGVLDREPDAALVQVIAERTGGNPFFVRELVRLLEGGAPAGGEVPPTVREVIERRLARLPDAVRALLSAAAVAGRQCDLRVVAAVAGLDEDEALDAVDAAVAARLVEEGESIGDYRFAHALVQESIAASLSRTRRARLHATFADAMLVRVEAGRIDLLPELAHHALEGALPGREEQAVRLAARAAAHALASLAFEEAAELCRRGLDLLDRHPVGDDVLRYELQLTLAWAQRDAGDDVSARDSLRAALECARRLDDPDRFARASIGFSGSVWWGWWTELGFVDHDAVAALEEALQRLPDTPSPRRVDVLGRLAVALYFVPEEGERREALSAAAVDMARVLGNDRVLANSLIHRHAAIWDPGSPQERAIVAAELTEIGRRNRWAATQLLGLQLQYAAALEAGDVAGWRAHYAAAHELADRVAPHQRIHQDWSASMVALLEGRLDDAERIMNEVATSTARWDAHEAMRTFATHLGQLRYDQGRFEELIAPLRHLVETEEIGTGWQSGLVLMLAADGRLDDARLEWEALLKMDDTPRASNLSWLFNDSLRAEAAYLLGDRDVAARMHDELLPFAGTNVVLFTRTLFAGPVSLCVGSLEACMGRFDEAEAHLEQACAETETLDARAWHTRSQLRLAECLLARGADGDASRAERLLADTIDAAESMGMRGVLDRARAVGSGAVDPVPRPG